MNEPNKGGIASHGDFECYICTNPETGEHRHTGGECICQDCVNGVLMNYFQDAMKFEMSFPPKAGDINLDYRDFVDILPPNYASRYYRKVYMMGQPVSLRLYCHNKRPDGQVCDYWTGLIGTMPCVRCDECHGCICGKCGFPSLPGQEPAHTCPPKVENTSIDQTLLESEDRGVAFQLCPNCNTRVFLGDGCNHMICPNPQCRVEHDPVTGATIRQEDPTNFCYVCGEAVAGPDSGHWNRGMPCPRFGHANRHSAIWDVEREVREEQRDNDSDDGEAAEEHFVTPMQMSDVVYHDADEMDRTLLDVDYMIERNLTMHMLTLADRDHQLTLNRIRSNWAEEIITLVRLENRLQNPIGTEVQYANLHRQLFDGSEVFSSAVNPFGDRVNQAAINVLFALHNLLILATYYDETVLSLRAREAHLDAVFAADSLRVLELDWPTLTPQVHWEMRGLRTVNEHLVRNGIAFQVRSLFPNESLIHSSLARRANEVAEEDEARMRLIEFVVRT